MREIITTILFREMISRYPFVLFLRLIKYFAQTQTQNAPMILVSKGIVMDVYVVHGALRTAIAGIHPSGTDSFFRISRKLNEIDGYMYREKLLEILSFTTYSKIIDIGEIGTKKCAILLFFILELLCRILKVCFLEIYYWKIGKRAMSKDNCISFSRLMFRFSSHAVLTADTFYLYLVKPHMALR